MPGRRITWVMLLGAGAVLGLTALQWREIAVRWQMAKLEGDEALSSLPAELLPEQQGTVRHEALVRFVKTEKGKERLLRRYVKLVNNESNQRMDGVGAGAHRFPSTAVPPWRGERRRGGAANARSRPAPAQPVGGESWPGASTKCETEDAPSAPGQQTAGGVTWIKVPQLRLAPSALGPPHAGVCDAMGGRFLEPTLGAPS